MEWTTRRDARVSDLVGSGITDGGLIQRWQERGDTVALNMLIRRYQSQARVEARQYYLPGGTQDDLQQEALIALYQAASGYDHAAAVSFRTFARVCMRNRIIQTLRSARRRKHLVLTEAQSLTREGSSDDEEWTMDVASPELDPAEVVVTAAWAAEFKLRFLTCLSQFETHVAALYVSGVGQSEIATMMGGSVKVKSVDNALSRVKRKARSEMGSEP
jgi:RNA polymerase sporulation-specific sigma factor